MKELTQAEACERGYHDPGWVGWVLVERKFLWWKWTACVSKLQCKFCGEVFYTRW